MESVKVTTKYDEGVLKDFFKFHYKKMFLLLLICGVVLVVMGALLAFLSSPVTGIVSALLGVFFAFYSKIVSAISMNANKKLINAEDEYEFKEESVKIISTILGEEVSNLELKYTLLDKVVEDEKYMYVYINKASSIIIKKRDLKPGEYEFIVHNVTKGIASKLNKNK